MSTIASKARSRSLLTAAFSGEHFVTDGVRFFWLLRDSKGLLLEDDGGSWTIMDSITDSFSCR